MEIKIKLSDELMENIRNGKATIKDLIKLLLDTGIAKNYRGIELNSLSLDKLLVNEKLINEAKIDIENEELILILFEKVQEKIELTNTIITDDIIKIDNSYTSYINIGKAELIDIKELLKKYKEIVKLCKEQGIKVSNKNKTKKYLQENSELYLYEVKKDYELFEELKEGWKNKIEIGLYYGTSDDKEIDRLAKIRYEKEKLHYRNRVISKVKDIEKEYNDILKELHQENNFYSIAL